MIWFIGLPSNIYQDCFGLSVHLCHCSVCLRFALSPIFFLPFFPFISLSRHQSLSPSAYLPNYLNQTLVLDDGWQNACSEIRRTWFNAYRCVTCFLQGWKASRIVSNLPLFLHPPIFLCPCFCPSYCAPSSVCLRVCHVILLSLFVWWLSYQGSPIWWRDEGWVAQRYSEHDTTLTGVWNASRLRYVFTALFHQIHPISLSQALFSLSTYNTCIYIFLLDISVKKTYLFSGSTRSRIWRKNYNQLRYNTDFDIIFTKTSILRQLCKPKSFVCNWSKIANILDFPVIYSDFALLSWMIHRSIFMIFGKLCV